MGGSITRARWSALGAAIAVTLGATGGFFYAHADSAASSFISIAPCRLIDTRPASLVGTRTTPLGTSETLTRQVTGTNGGCTIPANATGIAYNLTVPEPTTSGYIKLYPADAAVPGASAINPVANGGTKANSGIVGLSATGAVAFFNLLGPTDVVFDITGYFLPASAGPPGPPGPRGFSSFDQIPSGQTVVGNFGVTEYYKLATSANFAVNLPGKASTALLSANINFAPDAQAQTIDDDATCTGTVAAPTAPAGKVCLYSYGGLNAGIINLQGFQAQNVGDQAFYVAWTSPADTSVSVYLTWAYTAP